MGIEFCAEVVFMIARGIGFAGAGLLVSIASLMAQGNLGGLTGSVVDRSGALIPDVHIQLRNLETNLTYATLSGAGGYTFRALPPGAYRLEAEKAGFRKVVHERITVMTATTTTLDLVLDVGAVAESVTVAADVVALQTSSPEVGTVLQRQALLDLPIQIGGGASTIAASGRRQPETFIFLTPGVTGNQWSKTINGNPDFSQEVLIDGVSAQLAVTPGFLAQTSPPYEAIEEFKVQNTLFPVEFGRGFGVINYTLRSGSNQFHGGLFEFVRNDKFDARPFFNRTRPVVRFNEFGGYLGGPVWIPKLYQGKDRTFFNFNYTGLRNAPPLPGNLISVPPREFKNGDFSGYVDAGGNLIPIFDPATTLPDGTRTPFPANRIPASRFSRVGSKVLNLIPDPDLPGYFDNYINRTSNPVSDSVWSLKADQILTAGQRLSFTWWSSLNEQTVASPLGQRGGPLAFWMFARTTGKNYRFNYTYSIRPTLLLNLAHGYTMSNPTRQRDRRQGNKDLQIPGIPEDAPGYATFNVTTPVGGITNLGNSNQQPNDPSQNAIWSVNGSMNWIRGRHQWKFGGENRIIHYNNFGATGDGGLSGTFQFHSLSTSNLSAPNSSQLGNGYASLLLGEVYSAMRLLPAPERHMQHSFRAWFVEDTMKLGRKLTVTLGLRHELPTVVHEKDGLQSYLDLNLPNPGAAGRPGALAFLTGGRKALLDNYYRAFSPRIGLAYAIDEKTVLRAGFGIFFSPTNATNIGRFAGLFTAGLSYRQDFPQLFGGRVSVLRLDNGIPESPIKPPVRDPALQNNGTIDFINPGAAKPGYNSSWTFNVQRELPASILLDIGYVGQRGTNLPSGLENLNQVDFRYLSLGGVLLQSVTSTAAVAAGIRPPYPGFTGSVLQALRPYPQFTDIRNLFQPIGWSTYHSMQLRAQKRYRNGISVLVAYTVSKSFVSGAGYTGFGDDASNGRPLDTNNRGLEKRLAGFDMPQNLVLSWTYELPFGKGRRWANGASGLVNQLVSGWQLNAIQRYASGTPIGVSGGGRIPVGGGFNRPSRLPGVSPLTSVTRGQFDPARDRYLNIDAFQNTPDYVVGTAAPNFGDMRVFGMRNEDFSVLKSFAIHEQHRLQFRAEFFNLFNKVVFGGPATNVAAPASFGRISSQANEPRHIQLGLKYLF
jgi:hypothetical protein